MNIKNITTPTTQMWGDAIKNFVKMFVPIYVIAVTVYSLGVDMYRKPSLVTDWLFANHTTHESPVLSTSLTEVEAEVQKAVSPLLDIPVEKEHTQVLTTSPEVRHRITRRRTSMDLIRSLSA